MIPAIMRPFLALIALAFNTSGLATDYYVSRDGDDQNPGTESAPWRSIQKAADTLSPGDTAFVRAGKYKERVTVNVSGSAEAGFITIRNFPGETPIVDGRGKVPPKNEDTGLFLIADQSYVIIQGFEIRNYKAARGPRVPAGIFVIGACDHIEIRDNEIHGIKYNSRKGNAFGIVIYGTSATHPITRVIIDGNEVHHCKLGNSETIVLNGNVTDFEVTRNIVHDNNNLGIVFIGFEGSCPDPAQDQARDGVCRENVVSKISSFGNPAYGREYSAGGIYVDGGARILIERNVSYRNDIGIELASEHAGRVTIGVIVRDNLFYQNKIGGLFMGGYDAQRGGTEDCTITNNTFVGNDTKRFGNGEVYLQHFVTGVRVNQNIFLAGKQSLLVGNPTTTNTGNIFDYNLYFAPDGETDSAWQWLKDGVTGFAAWKSLSGQDVHSIFADPLLVDPTGGNFHLSPGSPAIDAGDPTFIANPDETDIDGDPRQGGSRVDLGADEI